MSINLVTLTDPDGDEIDVDVGDYDDLHFRLIDSRNDDRVTMTRKQLQQLADFARKEGWIR